MQTKKVKWYDRMLLDRPSKIVLAGVVLAVISPMLLYTFTLSSTLDVLPPDGYSAGSCLLPRQSRLPCGKEHVTEAECHPQCCYDLNSNICYHRLPSRFSYVMDRDWNENLDLHPRIATEPYSLQANIPTIRLMIDEISNTHLSITFYNPLETGPKNGRIAKNKEYSTHVSSPELNIRVTAPQGVIFDTLRGPLIAADSIWETSFRLTNETMYGFGEIPLTSTKIIYSNKNDAASIPLIYAKSNNSYHSLLIDIDNPTEVRIGEDNHVIVRSIARTEIKFHLFIGPHPRDVMRDVMDWLGYDNKLEYWMMGAHVCSELEEDAISASENLSNFMTQASNEGLPYESHCGPLPLIFNKDCSDINYLQAIENGARLIQGQGKKFIPHLSPYVLHTETLANTSITKLENASCPLEDIEIILLRNKGTEEIYIGTAGINPVVYPDYKNVKTLELLNRFWTVTANYQGIVLENNWPLDDSFTWVNETHLYLPYFNQNFEAAFQSTPHWNTTFFNETLFLYQENSYGNNFYYYVKDVANLSAVYTSSQWMNLEAIVNRQNVETSWANLHRQMMETALGSVSGHWLWSAPVCGDTASFNPEAQTALCVKWYMASTYFPLIKIHSKTEPRHPLAFTGTNKRYILEALEKRQSLLPYFYTVLQEAPLLRPMFYQYPEVDYLTDITTQYNVGDDLLIVPNLLPSQTHVNVWMPPGEWFELWSGLKLDAGGTDTVTMTTTEADFVTLIKGGSIIPMQQVVKASAEETRRSSPYTLFVALQYTDGGNNGTSSYGKLYVNTNKTFHFHATEDALKITSEGEDFLSVCGDSPVASNIVKYVNVYGLNNTQNNFDHHKHLEVNLDLCDLRNTTEIHLAFA